MPISPNSLNGYQFNSEAERKVYIAAKESRYFDNTERFLFHSLKMVNTGGQKLKAEIDFVYLDNECLLFLEVKGGEVKFNSLSNEWWVLGGTEKGDPFEQAYKGLFQTRDNLLPALFKGKAIPGRLTYGIGVLFPDSLKPQEFHKYKSGLMEYDPELIFDYTDYKRIGLIPFIDKLKTYWSEHPQFAGRTGISNKEMSAISKYFRQDLHFRLPVCDLLKKAGSQIDHFTGMQMYVLDSLNLNPGKAGVIMGGPGTGKTVLALELLKRKLAEGKKVLFVCYNKNLAEHCKKTCTSLQYNGEFEVSNIHQIYSDQRFIEAALNGLEANNLYWHQELPLFFARNLRTEKKGYFDYIIMDEGQDLLNEYHFDAINSLLKGGLDSGNWTIFMDKECQNIYNEAHAEEYFKYIREVYPCVVQLLSLNCRNTSSVIKRASIETGFPEMPCLRTDDNWISKIIFFNSPIDFKNRLNQTVLDMEAGGIKRSHITILCLEKTQIDNIIGADPNRYSDGAFPMDGKINVCSIHSYKGLENRFILICGPDNYDTNNRKQMSLIYIAATRATEQSVFYLDKRFEQIIIDRIDA